MFKQFWNILDRELIRVGVWGRPAAALKQDLYDHYQTEKESLLKQGKSEGEAEQIAIDQLGLPRQLAQKTQTELARSDGGWFPKFFLRVRCVVFFPAIWLALLLTISIIMAFVDAWFGTGVVTSARAVYLIAAIQLFGPWVAAFFWVLRASLNSDQGWRHLLIISGYLTLSVVCYELAWNIYFAIKADYYSQFVRHPGIRYWPTILMELAQCVPLLGTPWIVRAIKLWRSSFGSSARPQELST